MVLAHKANVMFTHCHTVIFILRQAEVALWMTQVQFVAAAL